MTIAESTRARCRVCFARITDVPAPPETRCSEHRRPQPEPPKPKPEPDPRPWLETAEGRRQERLMTGLERVLPLLPDCQEPIDVSRVCRGVTRALHAEGAKFVPSPRALQKIAVPEWERMRGADFMMRNAVD